MPMPLSEKVTRLGVGIDRDLDRERRAVLDQFRLGDRLVAQLLAGVGGVGDELADENLPVGIDRMDHELQQARNVGLEALCAGGFAGRGLGVGGQRANLSEMLESEMPAETARRSRYRGAAALMQAVFQPYVPAASGGSRRGRYRVALRPLGESMCKQIQINPRKNPWIYFGFLWRNLDFSEGYRKKLKNLASFQLASRVVGRLRMRGISRSRSSSPLRRSSPVPSVG